MPPAFRAGDIAPGTTGRGGSDRGRRVMSEHPSSLPPRAGMAADTTLSDVLDAIAAHARAGEYETVADLLQQHTLAAWWGFRPEALASICAAVVDAGADSTRLIRGILLFITSTDEPRFPYDATPEPPLDPSSPLGTMMELGRVFALRLQGRADAALQTLDEIRTEKLKVQPIFTTRGGADLVVALQTGITAMLAGDFPRALTAFATAQFHVRVPTLTFLFRDAHAKAAIVHASAGDPAEARAEIARARALPRTVSWTEPLIDAGIAIAEALIETEDPDRGVTALNDIPFSDIGEMWPFYALAVDRVYRRAGRWSELGERVALLERLPLPRENGEGLPGSVLPVIRAEIALARGDTETAKWFLDSADPDYVGTRCALLDLELALARPARALRAAAALRTARTAGMRRIELRRYAGLAAAHLALDETDAAREALRSALRLPGGLRDEDGESFLPSVRAYAAEHVPGWPTELSGAGHESISATVRLTTREREILRLLASDRPRAEIAAELFVTLNTLKSHLKAIYKKLGVTSRSAALLRAESEGWIS